MAQGNTNFGADDGVSGTVGADGFLGPVTGDVTGNVSGTLSPTFATVTAAGSNSQANAAALTAQLNVVVTVSATTRAVKLPTAAAGKTLWVMNSTATAVKVYPATGDKIGAAATNAVSTNAIATFKGAMFAAKDAVQWVALRGA